MTTADDSPKSPPPSGEDEAFVPKPLTLRKSERPSARPGGSASMLGQTLSGRYRIERIVGEGGMGTVYAVEHMHMRKRLAVKILHPEMSRLPEVVARFEREAMAAAHIDHPNVAAATDFGKLEDGSFFLVLEYVEGKSLREAIALGRLELGRALHVLGQIASALGRAHAIGIVHRDLKPENVMLVQREEDPDFVKVLDFGIAKVPVGELSSFEMKERPAQPILTQLGMVYGTPEYMAPEQALGQVVDRRADLYALGVIAYEMLTGFRPFDHESKVTLLGMHVTAPVRPMADMAVDANVPPEIEAIVVRLLAKEAAHRFTDARDLLETMGATLVGLASEGRIDATLLEKVLGASSPLSSGLRSPILASRASLVSAPVHVPVLESTRSVLALASVKSALRRVTGKTWAIAAASLGAIVFLILFLTVLGNGTTPVAAVAPIEGGTTLLPDKGDATEKIDRSVLIDQQVTSAEQIAAKGDAPEAIRLLGPLEQAYPNRADVHRALERAFAVAHDTKSALREADQWLAADPAAASDRRLADDLRAAALGKDDPEVALGLLETRLGSAGADVLYDLAYGSKNPSAVAARAHLALQSPEVRGHASPAVLISLDLRSATTCEARRALLPRAREVGDARTLTVLSAYTPTSGCGFLRGHDCWPCLHRDGVLASAISTIAARSGTSP
jgi:serine/threonine-protein kinase